MVVLIARADNTIHNRSLYVPNMSLNNITMDKLLFDRIVKQLVTEMDNLISRQALI